MDEGEGSLEYQRNGGKSLTVCTGWSLMANAGKGINVVTAAWTVALFDGAVCMVIHFLEILSCMKLGYGATTTPN